MTELISVDDVFGIGHFHLDEMRLHQLYVVRRSRHVVSRPEIT